MRASGHLKPTVLDGLGGPHPTVGGSVLRRVQRGVLQGPRCPSRPAGRLWAGGGPESRGPGGLTDTSVSPVLSVICTRTLALSKGVTQYGGGSIHSKAVVSQQNQGHGTEVSHGPPVPLLSLGVEPPHPDPEMCYHPGTPVSTPSPRACGFNTVYLCVLDVLWVWTRCSARHPPLHC